MNTKSNSDIERSAILRKCLREQNDTEIQQSPSAALASVVNRIETIAYTRGVNEVLLRMEMLAAIIPSSVTKEQMIAMLHREIADCLKKWSVNVAASDRNGG